MNPLAAVSAAPPKEKINANAGEQEPGFPFTAEEIERRVKEAPGIYALGYLDENQTFIIRSLGRADADLRDELNVRLFLLMGADLIAGPEDDLKSKYARFTFDYARTADEAFEKECLEYHELWETGIGLEELDDRRHPTKEADKDGRRAFCPIWQCGWNY